MGRLVGWVAFFAIVLAAIMLIGHFIGDGYTGKPPAPPACVTNDTGIRDCPLRTHNPN